MYPTKEEILNKEIKFKKELLKGIIDWKEEIEFQNKSPEINIKPSKILQLAGYLNILNQFYLTNVGLEFTPNAVTSYYSPKNTTIYLDKTLSIISLFHEFAHHLYGSSELRACQWSVWLFKKTFPKAYDRLEWKGHMLIKPKVCSTT